MHEEQRGGHLLPSERGWWEAAHGDVKSFALHSRRRSRKIEATRIAARCTLTGPCSAAVTILESLAAFSSWKWCATIWIIRATLRPATSRNSIVRADDTANKTSRSRRETGGRVFARTLRFRFRSGLT